MTMDKRNLMAMNMKRKYNHIVIGVSLLLCAFTTPLAAQKLADITPAGLERIKLTDLWQQSSNAAGLAFEPIHKYSYVDVLYQYYDGQFHRPQQGKDGNSLHFSSEGNLLLNKTRVWGFFSYRRDNLKGTVFNSSILDPYRGMPYYVADTVSSDWKNQHYQLGFKVAQPLGKSF